MPDTHERMLSLLSLLQTPRLWSGGELADRLTVSRRTVRRDIYRLRTLGYPVQALRGGEGGYHLKGGVVMPPLLLTDDEAVAVALGLRGVASQPVVGIEESSVRALTKVSQELPSRLRRRVETLSTALTVAAPFARSVRPVDIDTLTVVSAAIANHERLRFRYRKSDEEPAARHTEPVVLVPSGRRWHLIAYDLDRDDWRTFRLERITHPAATGARAAHTEVPGRDPAAFLEARSIQTTPVFVADVIIDAARDELQRWSASSGGTLTDLAGGRCHWQSAPDTLDWLTMNLIRLHRPFTIDTPMELVGHVAAVAARLQSVKDEQRD